MAYFTGLTTYSETITYSYFQDMLRE
jgi:hypothetical protein